MAAVVDGHDAINWHVIDDWPEQGSDHASRETIDPDHRSMRIGEPACKGRSIPMDKLDQLVTVADRNRHHGESQHH